MSLQLATAVSSKWCEYNRVRDHTGDGITEGCKMEEK